MKRLHMHACITVCIGYLENIGSLSYAELPNVNMFHFAIQKKKSQLHSECGECKFSKILNFACKLEFYYWIQKLSVVFFEVPANISFCF